jgi:hypothetical protein
LSLFQAPGTPVAVGWHAESELQVVDAIAALGRGSALRWSNAVRTPTGVARAAELVGAQSTVETLLPAGVGAVLVSAAVADPSAAVNADLGVAANEGALGSPLLFAAQGEEAALYPVLSDAPLQLVVTSRSGYRLTGVIGLRGRAEELAPLLHGTSLAGLVPNGPLSVDGSVHVTLTGAPR